MSVENNKNVKQRKEEEEENPCKFLLLYSNPLCNDAKDILCIFYLPIPFIDRYDNICQKKITSMSPASNGPPASDKISGQNERNLTITH
jgi:hypothetical protein